MVECSRLFGVDYRDQSGATVEGIPNNSERMRMLIEFMMGSIPTVILLSILGQLRISQ